MKKNISFNSSEVAATKKKAPQFFYEQWKQVKSECKESKKSGQGEIVDRRFKIEGLGIGFFGLNLGVKEPFLP